MPADTPEADELEPASDEEDRGRTALLRLEAFLARRSPGFVLLVGILLLILISLIDTVSGRFDVTLFYLMPVALVTFSRGRSMGVLLAGVASIAWAGAEVVNRVTSIDSSITYWNAITRFYAYVLVVLLIAPMRRALLFEREAAEKEAEAAEQLRALMELRDAAERATWEDPYGDDRAREELRDALHSFDRDSTPTTPRS